jgi:hypothetical protein
MNRPAATDLGLAEINKLYDNLGIDAKWSVWEPRGFTWWGWHSAQRVWSEPARDVASGVASQHLTFETHRLVRATNSTSTSSVTSADVLVPFFLKGAVNSCEQDVWIRHGDLVGAPDNLRRERGKNKIYNIRII